MTLAGMQDLLHTDSAQAALKVSACALVCCARMGAYFDDSREPDIVNYYEYM
jgi:hypothetical protein